MLCACLLSSLGFHSSMRPGVDGSLSVCVGASQFIGVVADAPLMGKRYPAAIADVRQPLLIGGMMLEVICMTLDPQAGGPQNFREFLAQVAVREKDRSRVHAARS